MLIIISFCSLYACFNNPTGCFIYILIRKLEGPKGTKFILHHYQSYIYSTYKQFFSN